MIEQTLGFLLGFAFNNRACAQGPTRSRAANQLIYDPCR